MESPSKTLLLLTPIPYDARVWGQFTTRLELWYEVHAATWPGHGPERRAAAERTFDMLTEGTRFAESIVGGPDVVLAVGTDAVVAVHLALHGHARAIVLVNPVPNGALPEVPVDVEAEIANAFASVPEVVAAIEADDMTALAAALAEPSRSLVSTPDYEILTEVIRDNIDRFANPVDYSQGDDPFWPNQLGMIDVPVLVIAQTYTPRPGDLLGRYAEAIAARCQRGSLARVEARTEFPWLERPESIAQLVGAL